MKSIRVLFAVLALVVSTSAWAQLKPYTDYEPGKEVTNISTIKVHPNMINDYLEGIRKTWVASAEVSKKLGHITDYGVYVSELPLSGDFNIVLTQTYASSADQAPSRERYEAFQKAWGDANEAMVRGIVKDYPAMREITGEYNLRKITFK